jgi:hypothetical protein
MYQITWDTLTNIGIDLLSVVFTRLFNYDVVGRIFVAAAVLLPPIGGIVLWRSLHGRRHWWELSFCQLAWGMGLLLGFLNFEIGLGMALLSAGVDLVLARRGVIPLVAGRICLGGALLLMHAFALVFYAALLCGLAIGPNLRGLFHRPNLMRLIKSLAGVVATLAIPVLLLVLLAPSLPGKQTGTNLQTAAFDFHAGFEAVLDAPMSKIEGAFLGLRGYSKWLDGLTLLAIVLPIAVSLITRRLRVHAGMALVCLGLLACYFVCPSHLAGTYWIDARFAWMAPFALLAALRPELSQPFARLSTALLLSVGLLRTADINYVWQTRQADVAALYDALAALPEGAKVLPLNHQSDSRVFPGRVNGIGGFSSFAHLAVLAIPVRHAFVPTLFAARGKQPIEVRPPYDQIADPEGGTVADARALVDPTIYVTDLEEAPYLKFWKTRFDFALVLNTDVPDKNPLNLSNNLTLVKDTGFARLYQIIHATPQRSADTTAQTAAPASNAP